MKLRLFLLSLLAFACLHTTAQAQTSTDPNEGSQFSQNPTTGIYTFSWWGRAGRTYFLQQSDDLINWTYLPVIESGDEQVIQWGFTSTAAACFLRLKYTDVYTDDPFGDDFNNDGLSNWQNLMQGSDPLGAPLMDTNGFSLNWEQFYNVPAGTDPNSLAPCGYNITYLQAYQQGLNPNTYIPPPSGLIASPSSPTTIHLSWINATTDSGGVLVERSTDGGQTWTTIATLSSTALTYDDENVSTNVSYRYRVSALSKNGGNGGGGGTSSPSTSYLSTPTTQPISPEMVNFGVGPVAQSGNSIDIYVYVANQTDPITAISIYDVTNGTRTKILDAPANGNGCEWTNAPVGKHYLLAQATDNLGNIFVSSVQTIDVLAYIIPPQITYPPRDLVVQTDLDNRPGVFYLDTPVQCGLLSGPQSPQDGKGYTKGATTYKWSGDYTDSGSGPDLSDNYCSLDTSTTGPKSATITMVTTWKASDGTSTTTELDDTLTFHVVDVQIQANAQAVGGYPNMVQADLVGTLPFTLQVSGAQSGDGIRFNSGTTSYKVWAVQNGVRKRVAPGQVFDATNLPSFEVEATSDKYPLYSPAYINNVLSLDCTTATGDAPNIYPTDPDHDYYTYVDIEPGIRFNHMVEITSSASVMPTTGVSCASVQIQKIYPPNESDYTPAAIPTAIKINGKAASNILQDANSSGLFYFDLDVSSAMTVGSYDLEVDNLSFVNIPPTNAIVTSGINVTDNVDIGISSFSTATNVAVQKAGSIASNVTMQGGSLQDAETAYEESTDSQVSVGSYLVRTFLTGQTIDDFIAADLQNMQATGDYDDILVCLNEGFSGGMAATSSNTTASTSGSTTSATPSPQFGSASFFADVKSYLATTGSKVYQGSYGDTQYAVINADDFKLKTYDLGAYPAGSQVGKTIDDTISANPGAGVIINGAFFNWHVSEPLFTCGVVLNNGVVLPTSNVGKPSHVASDLRFWFGQIFDHSVAQNAGQGASYHFGGEGNPPIPAGTTNPTDLNAAIGGLTSLILQDSKGVPQKISAKLDDPDKGDTDLNTFVGFKGKRTGFGGIGVNHANGMVIIFGKAPTYVFSQSVFDVQSKLYDSGVDDALLTDGGSSVGLAVNNTVVVRSNRHKSPPDQNETVTSYFIFVPNN